MYAESLGELLAPESARGTKASKASGSGHDTDVMPES